MAIDKETLNKLMEVEGDCAGVVFRTDADYIRKVAGDEALEKVEEETGRMGYRIDYSAIKSGAMLSIGLRVVSLLAIKEALNWDDKHIMEMGCAAPKKSFITKLIMRFAVSMDKIVRVIPEYWHKHYTIGSLKVIKMDIEMQRTNLELRRPKNLISYLMLIL